MKILPFYLIPPRSIITGYHPYATIITSKLPNILSSSVAGISSQISPLKLPHILSKWNRGHCSKFYICVPSMWLNYLSFNLFILSFNGCTLITIFFKRPLITIIIVTLSIFWGYDSCEKLSIVIVMANVIFICSMT